MSSILYSQLFRLRKFNTFWVMLIIIATLPIFNVVLSLVGVYIFSVLVQGTLDPVQTYEGLTVAIMGDNVGLSTLPTLLSLICTAIFLAREFGNGTIRNAIIANKTRKEIYLSYTIIGLIIGGTFQLANYFSYLVSYSVCCGFGKMKVFDVLGGCFSSLLLCLCCTVFIQTCTTMFLFVGRKQSTALTFPILVMVFVEGVVGMIVSIVSAFLNEDQTGWYQWVPLFNIEMFDATAVDPLLVCTIAVELLALSVLFVFIGWTKFRKADLK